MASLDVLIRTTTSVSWSCIRLMENSRLPLRAVRACTLSVRSPLAMRPTTSAA